MNHIWAGRMLLRASPALRERYLACGDRIGPGAACVGAISGELLRQVGLWLLLDEPDDRRPFARTRGVLRFPSDVTPAALAKAVNALTALTTEYLQGLPGVPDEIDTRARRALRHAGSAMLEILRALRSGEPPAEILGRIFGGAPLLAFAAGPRPAVRCAPS